MVIKKKLRSKGLDRMFFGYGPHKNIVVKQNENY